jgi:hypothetical protein
VVGGVDCSAKNFLVPRHERQSLSRMNAPSRYTRIAP